ncbi:helix-turn-helix domain-containing protein [Nocardiopsis composta]|uniref:Transcriptional regulator with XRE-family HTH domain n=1 Tax=Nocardiopsis composta TaxID=157465 RepID=A0A7W8VCI8_9ACTN|nr:helix-turn-helix transcriptional regulator [Nocardiopsis composta]MBB5431247.1 transcriptional regulator with XRE-family HTH domain [Nocardiopsis composta]
MLFSMQSDKSEHRRKQIRRWGGELRRLRELAGFTQAELGDSVGYSGPQISALERGTRRPSRKAIEKLDGSLSTGGALARLWVELHEPPDVPEPWRDFLIVERESVEIREYAGMIIPGLAQTSDYARGVLHPGREPLEDEETEELVRVRLERLGRLRSDVRVWMVIEEAVLRRVVRSPRVQAEALAHLADLAETRRVRVAIIPSEAPLRPALAGSFRVARVSDGRMLAFAEYVGGETLITQSNKVGELLGYFGDLQADSLSTEESVKLIRKVEGELR